MTGTFDRRNLQILCPIATEHDSNRSQSRAGSDRARRQDFDTFDRADDSRPIGDVRDNRKRGVRLRGDRVIRQAAWSDCPRPMGQSRRVFASSGNVLGSSYCSPLGPKCWRTMSSSVSRSSSRWLLNRLCRIMLLGISFILRSITIIALKADGRIRPLRRFGREIRRITAPVRPGQTLGLGWSSSVWATTRASHLTQYAKPQRSLRQQWNHPDVRIRWFARHCLDEHQCVLAAPILQTPSYVARNLHDRMTLWVK
jgi:hypothetical protein